MSQNRKCYFRPIVAVSVLVVVCQSFAQTPTPTPIQGDRNQDGSINAIDLLLTLEGLASGDDLLSFQRNWQMAAPPGNDMITINLPNLPSGARPLRLVRISAGSFSMGNLGEEPDQYCVCPSGDCACELPRHTVAFGYDFYMGETEITQAQWEAVMGLNPASDYGVGNDYPAYYVRWADLTKSNGFLDNINALGQGTFRLPSEAEWEYACRGSAANPNRYAPFSFGGDLSVGDPYSCSLVSLYDSYMWWCGNDSTYQAKPVAGKEPNDYGLYDMHGNLWEWCQDYWHPSYAGAPADGSAWEVPADMDGYRVIRGGCWNNLPYDGRSALRNRATQGHLAYDVGFRIVLTASSKSD